MTPIIGDIPSEPVITTAGTSWPSTKPYDADWREPVTPKLPTRRTVRKAGRDFIVALVGFCVAYTASHQADFGLTPEVSAAIPVVALALWRYGRSLLGAEPE